MHTDTKAQLPLFTQLPAIGQLAGWRRNLTAFVCGVLAMLALPPFFIVPFMVPACCGLLWLINGAASRRRLFWDGWFWGWGYYMSGLYWFCIALMTDAEKFAWLLPFALFGLTGVIAIYQGLICWLMGFFRVSGFTRIFVFSVVWLLVEFARGHLFTGFPWNLAGYTLAVSDVSIQLASLVGIYGLTWLVIFLALLPSSLGDADIGRRRALRVTGAAYLLFAIALAWGGWRLHAAGHTQYVDGVMLRLVQANIAQHHKWDPALQVQGLQKHIELSRAEGIENITHVIWPETAAPYIIDERSKLLQILSAMLPADTKLITGGLRAEGESSDWRIYNSIVMVDSAGAIVGTYDKNRLVPFGEFLPFRSLIPEKWATPVGNKDFSRGPGAVTLDWPGLPGVTPLICYEAIFPEFAAGAHPRPKLFLNLTNDAWFGTSTAPYQHLHMSRMRAVEQGIPLIRVANTGMSLVVDAMGRVLKRSSLNQIAVIDTRLPQPENSKTLYGFIGDRPIILLLMLAVLLFLGMKKKNIYLK
ncbi:MAG: apolipoprotein N-acyltransferase [Alphaproteobacteria bacterium]